VAGRAGIGETPADAIVSGDRDLLALAHVRDILILTPARFVALLT
jgi:predicted nucleic acid-binding protein